MKIRHIYTAFTLIEMLVVLVIIAVLAQYLVSLTASVRERAWRTRCISNIRQLAEASKMYESDYGQLPVHCPGGDPRRNFGHMLWRPSIDVYVRDSNIYLCPLDPQPQKGLIGGGGGPPVSYDYTLTCPWLGRNGEYRPPTVTSPLVVDGNHESAKVLLVARYDGSVEVIPWTAVTEDGIHYEPEDGLGLI
ncbi:MAG: type II secretion system protein, partial [Armatimonadota bacterium]